MWDDLTCHVHVYSTDVGIKMFVHVVSIYGTHVSLLSMDHMTYERKYSDWISHPEYSDWPFM